MADADKKYLDSEGVQILLENLTPVISAAAFPVGYVLISAVEMNPANLYGGEWMYLTDTHLFQGWYIYVRTA